MLNVKLFAIHDVKSFVISSGVLHIVALDLYGKDGPFVSHIQRNRVQENCRNLSRPL